MRFSLYCNPQTRGEQDDLANVDATVEHALMCDEAGMSAIFLTEHHFSNYNTYANPFMFGTYLAPRLKQAYVGLSVAVAPLHQPLRLAESINVLDLLTKGRCIVGLAPGGSPLEFAGFGLDPGDRHAHTEQVLDVVVKALAHRIGDPVLEFDTPSGRGQLFSRIMPASYRQPRPLLARATLSNGSIVSTAKRGWPVMLGRFDTDIIDEQISLYKESLFGSGHDETTVKECLEWITTTQMVYVAETDEQAIRECEVYLDNYLTSAILSKPADMLLGPGERPPEQLRPDARGLLPYIGPAKTREAYYRHVMTVGSPETVAKRLQAYGEVGVGNLQCHMLWGWMPPEQATRSLRLFLEEVLPRLNQDPPYPAPRRQPAATA